MARRCTLLRKGVNPDNLRLYTKVGIIEKHPAGLYGNTQSFGPIAQASLRVPRGILCLRSALWVHGIARTELLPVHVAIGARARKPEWTTPAVRFFRMRPSMFERDVVSVEYGTAVLRVFTLERTLVDCIRLERLIGEGWGTAALGLALRAGAVSAERIRTLAHERRAGRRVEQALAFATAHDQA
jgi:predicted transcriptional regulator of viral defense system